MMTPKQAARLSDCFYFLSLVESPDDNPADILGQVSAYFCSMCLRAEILVVFFPVATS